MNMLRTVLFNIAILCAAFALLFAFGCYLLVFP